VKNTILNGMLLLVPLAVLMVILGKVFEFARVIAKPMEQFFPMDRVVGVLLTNLLAAALLIASCYVIGFGAKRGILGKGLQRLDNFFFDIIPGYAVIKGVSEGFAKADDQTPSLTPVLVSFDDYKQIAYEIERSDDLVVVFLPGSPSAWSGSSVAVSADRVSRLNLSFNQATGLIRKMGRGTLAQTSHKH